MMSTVQYLVKELKKIYQIQIPYSLLVFLLEDVHQLCCSLACVQLFMTPWTAACQASLSFTISRSLIKFMSIESVILPNHLILSTLFSFGLQSFPKSGSFPMSQLFESGGQSMGASASSSVLPMNIQGWFPLELTGLISLLFKGLSRVFSNTAVQKYQFFGAQPSLWSNSQIHT